MIYKDKFYKTTKVYRIVSEGWTNVNFWATCQKGVEKYQWDKTEKQWDKSEERRKISKYIII